MEWIRKSDEELLKNGWMPSNIQYDPSQGPFAVYRIEKPPCAQCGGATTGFTVVNLLTATGISTEWTHADALVEAEEHAAMLNDVWSDGYQAGVASKGT